MGLPASTIFTKMLDRDVIQPYLYSNSITNNDFRTEFLSNKKVIIYGIDTVPLGTYSRTGNARYGTTTEISGSTQELTIDKTITFSAGNDNLDISDANQMGTITQFTVGQFSIVRIAIDEYVFGITASNALNTKTEVLTESNVRSEITLAHNVIKNANRGFINNVLVTHNDITALLKLDPGFLPSTELGLRMRLTGVIGTFDGLLVQEIPSSLLPTNTNFIISNPSNQIKLSKYDDLNIHVKPIGRNGTVIEFVDYLGSWVLNSKKNKIFWHKTA